MVQLTGCVSCLPQGYNCSCFAYGHTGSGKTYSMFGFNDDADLPGEDKSLDDPPEGEAYGLVPRLCYHLLRRLREGNAGWHDILGVVLGGSCWAELVWEHRQQ